MNKSIFLRTTQKYRFQSRVYFLDKFLSKEYFNIADDNQTLFEFDGSYVFVSSLNLNSRRKTKQILMFLNTLCNTFKKNIMNSKNEVYRYLLILENNLLVSNIILD